MKFILNSSITKQNRPSLLVMEMFFLLFIFNLLINTIKLIDIYIYIYNHNFKLNYKSFQKRNICKKRILTKNLYLI